MQNKNLMNNFMCVMPMAGEGIRFKNYGHKTPKPLIKINHIPMFMRSARSFPNNFKWLFIADRKIKSKIPFKKNKKFFKNKKFLFLNKKTNGQASTVYKSIKRLNHKDVIIVHSCDLTFDINLNVLKKKINENDLLVFVAKASRFHFKNHKQFSWVKRVKDKYKISLKKNFINKKDSKVLIGSFVFKNKKIMKKLINYIFKRKIKIKNEYYIDSIISIAQKLDYKLGSIQVNKYVSWGSHKELLNFFKQK